MFLRHYDTQTIVNRFISNEYRCLLSQNLSCFSISSDALTQYAVDSQCNSYVGMTGMGPYGGIAYVGTLCGNLYYRKAVVQLFGTDETGCAEVNI